MAGNPFLKKKLVEEKQTIKKEVVTAPPQEIEEEMSMEDEMEDDEIKDSPPTKKEDKRGGRDFDSIDSAPEEKEKRTIQRMPLSRDEIAYILKNYDKKTLADIARDLGLKPSKVNNFIKSLKESLKKVIQSPTASKEDKAKAKKKLEFLETARVKGEFGPQRKSDKDRASIYDDIFSEILK